ncbi:MAG: DsbA family protein [Phycisphaerales bacterium]|nr:DsbA family protein [Phycisphaerales bacterium]
MNAANETDPGMTVARRASIWVGGAALICALAASAVLSVGALGLTDSIPGCGLSSACGELAAGPWGRVPLLGIPVSFVGFAYFTAMLIYWFRENSTRLMRLVMRCAAVYSVFAIGLMVVLGSLCPWCLVAQIGNLVYWACTGIRSRGSVKPRKSRVVGVATVLVLVVAALMVVRGVFLERRAVESAERMSENIESIRSGAVEPRQPELLEGGNRIGPEDAAVQVVMFTDYQCPDCKRIETQMNRILESADDVSLTIKHFPFCAACNEHTGGKTMHPNACWAARASEAAAMLGGPEGFHRMHDWLFLNRGSFTDADFPDALRSLGFEPSEFIALMTSEQTLDRVRAHTDDAKALGVYFTPMVFVNGHEYTWYYGDEGSLRQAIDAGRVQSPQAPPGFKEKLVEDWAARPRVEPESLVGRSPLGEGRVEVVVFGDYRSEPARSLDAAVRGLIEEGRDVRYHFRHFPIDPDCNEHASGYSSTNQGSCDDARLVEAVELLEGPDARWRFHEALMTEDGSTSRAVMLEKLGLDVDAIRSLAQDDPGIQATISDDSARKMSIWRMHAPILLVDGRFVPRWQHDDVEPGSLLVDMLEEVRAEPREAE